MITYSRSSSISLIPLSEITTSLSTTTRKRNHQAAFGPTSFEDRPQRRRALHLTRIRERQAAFGPPTSIVDHHTSRKRDHQAVFSPTSIEDRPQRRRALHLTRIREHQAVIGPPTSIEIPSQRPPLHSTLIRDRFTPIRERRAAFSPTHTRPAYTSAPSAPPVDFTSNAYANCTAIAITWLLYLHRKVYQPFTHGIPTFACLSNIVPTERTLAAMSSYLHEAVTSSTHPTAWTDQHLTRCASLLQLPIYLHTLHRPPIYFPPQRLQGSNKTPSQKPFRHSIAIHLAVNDSFTHTLHPIEQPSAYKRLRPTTRPPRLLSPGFFRGFTLRPIPPIALQGKHHIPATRRRTKRTRCSPTAQGRNRQLSTAHQSDSDSTATTLHSGLLTSHYVTSDDDERRASRLLNYAPSVTPASYLA